MKGSKFMNVAGLCLAVFSGTVFAQDAVFELPSASGAYIKDYEAFKLAANETDVLVKKSGSAAPEVKKSEFEPSWLTGGKAHQYLGLGTIVLAGLTAATAPEGCLADEALTGECHALRDAVEGGHNLLLVRTIGENPSPSFIA